MSSRDLRASWFSALVLAVASTVALTGSAAVAHTDVTTSSGHDTAPTAEWSSAAPSAFPPNPSGAADVGRRAYDYGFPLLEFLRVRREMTSVRCPDGSGDAPVNSFSHARRAAGADDRTVVAPNTDTLYSIAHLDLGRGPLVLHNPRMGRRYYSFALLDPFTNVIDIPGAREDGPGAHDILIRWSRRPGAASRARYDRVITSRYRRVWVIGRTLASGERDQRLAYRKMLRYSLTRPNGHSRSFRPGVGQVP